MHVSYGWWGVCVRDEMSVGDYDVNEKYDYIKLVNRYDMLQHESSNEYDIILASVSPTCDVAHGNN